MLLTIVCARVVIHACILHILCSRFSLQLIAPVVDGQSAMGKRIHADVAKAKAGDTSQKAKEKVIIEKEKVKDKGATAPRRRFVPVGVYVAHQISQLSKGHAVETRY